MGSCTCKHGDNHKDDELLGKEVPKEAPPGAGDVDAFKDVDLSVQYQLAQALQLDLPFVAADLEVFDPFKDQLMLTAVGCNHLTNIAGLLKKTPETCIRVFGYTGPSATENDSILALAQARHVRDALQKMGCKGTIAAKGIGLVDSKGRRCELAICSSEEADQFEKEAAQLENSFDYRLAKALRLDLPFEGVDLTNFDPDADKCELKPQAWENLTKIAEVLKESASTCVRVFGYAGPPRHDNCVKLSLARTRRVRDALAELGCVNKIAAKGCGLADDRGPRCELAVCRLEEALAIEAEVDQRERAAAAAVATAGKGGALAILFLHEGKEVLISLTRRPLGLTFTDNTLPVKITKLTPGGHAAGLGVKVGMQVKAVNGQPVDGLQFRAIHHMLSCCSLCLPSA